MTNTELNHDGTHYSYSEVPIEFTPLQQPVPPIWYPPHSESSATWAGDKGYHYVTLGGTDKAVPNINAYKDAYAKRGGPFTPNDTFDGGTAIGIMRHMVIAETEEEAHRVASAT